MTWILILPVFCSLWMEAMTLTCIECNACPASARLRGLWDHYRLSDKHSKHRQDGYHCYNPQAALRKHVNSAIAESVIKIQKT
jgi:hypothetical protein